MELLRAECRKAGVKPKRLVSADVDWFRDHADDPMCEVAWDAADEGAHEEERLRTRRARKAAPPAAAEAAPAPRVGQGGRKAAPRPVSAPQDAAPAGRPAGPGPVAAEADSRGVTADAGAEFDPDDPDNWTAE